MRALPLADVDGDLYAKADRPVKPIFGKFFKGRIDWRWQATPADEKARAIWLKHRTGYMRRAEKGENRRPLGIRAGPSIPR